MADHRGTTQPAGASSPQVLSNRLALWQRRKSAERVDFFRVMRGVDHLEDFEAGPESADEIGAFGSLIADSEGTPVTLEIIGMRREPDEEISVRTISLRCLPTPALPAAPPVSEMAVVQVMAGYTQLQKASIEMMGGVTAALKTVGELTAQIIVDGAAREAAMREQIEQMHELMREALDTAKAAKAAAAPTSRAERLEKLIVEMVGSKVEKFAVGLLAGPDDDESQAESQADAPTLPGVQ